MTNTNTNIADNMLAREQLQAMGELQLFAVRKTAAVHVMASKGLVRSLTHMKQMNTWYYTFGILLPILGVLMFLNEGLMFWHVLPVGFAGMAIYSAFKWFTKFKPMYEHALESHEVAKHNLDMAEEEFERRIRIIIRGE